METYELCSDMIDVVIDVSGIYGYVVSYHDTFFLMIDQFVHMME
jgi:hypothetical protein